MADAIHDWDDITSFNFSNYLLSAEQARSLAEYLLTPRIKIG